MKKLLFVTIIIFIFLNGNSQSVKKGFAEVNGTRLYYEVVGEGEPILFIHGNGGDCRHWDYQFERLANRYLLIRYDVRGYGKSSLPNPEIQFSHYDDINELMKFLEIGKAHICGLSMGSAIAVNFALAFPGRCLSLISVGPWVSGYGLGDYSSPAADSMFSVMNKTRTIVKERGPKEATDYFLTGNIVFKKTFKYPETIKRMKQIGYDYTYWGFINNYKYKGIIPPAVKQLSNINIPTLIVTADNDLQACIEVSNLMEKEIIDSKKFIINDAGHVMIMDKPDEFNKILISFLDSL